MIFSSYQRRMIRQRSRQFADQWNSKQKLSESEDSEIFIDEFFGIFDIDCYASNIIFEYKLSSGRRIDAFWPGVILIENKSPGSSLSETCRQQAVSYYKELEDYLRPKYVLINNFHHFRIFSFRRGRGDKADYWEMERSFSLHELPSNRNISLFYYFSNHRYVKITETREQSDEKSLESLTKYTIKNEIEESMQKIKYGILKLGMVGSIFFTLGFTLGYFIPNQTGDPLESLVEESIREEFTR